MHFFLTAHQLMITDWLNVQLYWGNQNLNWGRKLSGFREPLASIPFFIWVLGGPPSPPTCNPKKAPTLIATRSRVFWVYRPVKNLACMVTCCGNLSPTHSRTGSVNTSPTGMHMPLSSQARVWCDEGHPALCSVPRGQSCWRSRKSSAASLRWGTAALL